MYDTEKRERDLASSLPVTTEILESFIKEQRLNKTESRGKACIDGNTYIYRCLDKTGLGYEYCMAGSTQVWGYEVVTHNGNVIWHAHFYGTFDPQKVPAGLYAKAVKEIETPHATSISGVVCGDCIMYRRVDGNITRFSGTDSYWRKVDNVGMIDFVGGIVI